ncbi:phosphatidylglycerophosphatase and protein-tyrosine phosphatase 1 isoform X2 [Otolemur garnettii]|uniref:phosphatidylglycerophosphatase and protein-tyrosine phosphatase 1 isoform X2 n=1 Tax=Otolemur garnettii TaxID=30611 RepID=UPI00064450AE|nr:phosphatidylglycerophosphatase and protein-tyrosine phosphatase 1 isoform X2 [Otolemur garnettii]
MVPSPGAPDLSRECPEPRVSAPTQTSSLLREPSDSSQPSSSTTCQVFSRPRIASSGEDRSSLRQAGWGGMATAALLEAGLARVLFYPTLLYTLLRGKMPGRGHRDWYHRIDSTVLLGALPLRNMTRQLVQDENVRAVITMNEEYETRFLCNSSQVHNWSPEEAVKAISEIRSHIHIRPGQLDVLKEFYKITVGAAKDETRDISKT